jgi:hypothetical protein
MTLLPPQSCGAKEYHPGKGKFYDLVGPSHRCERDKPDKYDGGNDDQ